MFGDLDTLRSGLNPSKNAQEHDQSDDIDTKDGCHSDGLLAGALHVKYPEGHQEEG